MRPYGAPDEDNDQNASRAGYSEDPSVVVYRPYAPGTVGDAQPGMSAGQYVEPQTGDEVAPPPVASVGPAAARSWVADAPGDDTLVTDVDTGRDLTMGGYTDTSTWSAITPDADIAAGTDADVSARVIADPPTYEDGGYQAQGAGYADTGYEESVPAYSYTAPADPSLYSDSGTAATDDVDIPDDPDAIRAGIEQTRAEMSDTINAIQGKLNPQILMDQAKDKLEDAASNILSNAKDTVREATVGRVEHMVSNVTDTAKDTGGNIVQLIKDNPVPAALLGLGLGWLFTRNLGSGGNRDNRDYRDYRAYSGYSGSRDYEGGYQPRAYDRANYAGYSSQDQGVVEQVTGRIKQNPVPAALAAAGLGWLLMGGGNNTPAPSPTYLQYRRDSGSQGGGIGDTVGQARDKVADVAGQARDTAQDVAGAAADRAGEVADKVGDVASQVRDTAGEVAGNVAQTAGNVAGTVGRTVGDVAGQTGSVAGGFLRTVSENPIPSALAAVSIGWLYMQSNSSGRRRLYRVGDAAGEVAGQAGETVGRLAETAGETVSNVADTVKYRADETQSQFQRMLLENPLAVGAAAVALGAAIGLAVPETPQEHQLMGAARDKLVDRAQYVAQDAMQRVQQATGEAMQRVEEVAGDVQSTVEQRASEIGQA